MAPIESPTEGISLSDSKRVPIVSKRHLPVSAIPYLNYAVRQYLTARDITDDAKVKSAWLSVFQHPKSAEHFTVNGDSIRKLALDVASDSGEFKRALYTHIVGIDWQTQVAVEINSVRQARDEDFAEVMNRIRLLNLLLKDTPYSYEDAALRIVLTNAMSDSFRAYTVSKNIEEKRDFQEWMTKIETLIPKHKKRVADEELRFKEALDKQREREAASQKRQRPTSSQVVESAPKRSNASFQSNANSRSSSGIPRFQDLLSVPDQKHIMMAGNVCSRCRSFNAGHRGDSCTQKNGPELSVAYRPLTQTDLEFAMSTSYSNGGRAVTLDEILSTSSSLASSAINRAKSSGFDLAQYLPRSRRPSTGNTADVRPVAAMFGVPNITHTAQGAYVFDRRQHDLMFPRATSRSSSRYDSRPPSRNNSPPPAPLRNVAPPLVRPNSRSSFLRGRSVAATIQDLGDDDEEYIPLDSRVRPHESDDEEYSSSEDRKDPVEVEDQDEEGDEASEDEDELESEVSHPLVSSLPQQPETCDHLWWNAAIPSNTGEFPVPVRALLDSAAHLVLIRPELVKACGLVAFPVTNAQRVGVAMKSEESFQYRRQFYLT